MSKNRTYIALAVVFVASVALPLLLPWSEAIRTVAAIPAIGALTGSLLLFVRDQLAHERSLRLLETENSFSMGATSHMANVALDKHVAFCEEYVSEIFNCLTTLTREGPTKNALPHAANLYQIQKKWVVWITPEVAKELERFEAAIRKIGSKARLLEVVPTLMRCTA